MRLCKECHFCQAHTCGSFGEYFYAICTHPLLSRSPVTGEPIHKSCSEQRSSSGECRPLVHWVQAMEEQIALFDKLAEGREYIDNP